MQSVDPDAYAHTYLGVCRFASEAQVFAGKYSIAAFEPDLTLTPQNDRRKDIYANLGRQEAVARIEEQDRESAWEGPFFGADWGFSVDPTTLAKCWIHKRVLYIEYEAYEIGCDIDKTPALFDQVPGARNHVIRGDNARPDTISYLHQNGYPRIESATKWKGSVEDGVAFMRSFEKIVIHPRCTNAAAEFRLYSHKVVKLTGDILPDLEDKNNHLIDAIRYALTPAIKRRRRARVVPLRV
jgi:phage terminase large subunit